MFLLKKNKKSFFNFHIYYFKKIKNYYSIMEEEDYKPQLFHSPKPILKYLFNNSLKICYPNKNYFAKIEKTNNLKYDFQFLNCIHISKENGIDIGKVFKKLFSKKELLRKFRLQKQF